jgi:hypothetical protein
MRRQRTIVVVFACLALAAAVTTAAAARPSSVRTYSTRATPPLRTAVFDQSLFGGSKAPTAFGMTSAAGATYVRLLVRWGSVAPASPGPSFVAADPTSPGYSWTWLDASVEAADAAGLTPILDIVGAPVWAYRNLPSGVNGGSPDVAALGDFATALATHYDGLSPGVPAEHVFQVWNEPNLSWDLDPASASTYRGMVNAVAASVKAVDPQNLVVAGGLDPFGHRKSHKRGWYSTAPLAFMRTMLCVSKGSHPHSTCSDAVHFDAWSHHPYTYGGPFGHAKKADDVELGDLPRMRALLKAAVRLHHIVSSQPLQFWVTEFGWATKPPKPRAASLGLAARWTAESLHQMWLSGVSLATWFLLEDYPSPSPYQSGLYFHAGSLAEARPKPGLTAFRFPFVAYLGKSGNVSVWGRDATSAKEVVTVQLRHGKSGRWRTVARIVANANGIFVANLKLKPKPTKKDWLRATSAASGKSLAFSLTRPHVPNAGPFSG